MALNPTEMTLQRLAVSLGQLAEQIHVSQAAKKDLQIEDVIKALNMTFKTTKGDIGELKNLLKIAKSTGNAAQYDKLVKMLELLVKSYDSPDVKQMARLGITTQNLITEIDSLRDEIKITNLKGNQKANLSLLSKAIAEGQRQYALSGFGRNASEFYKKATLEQMRLLQQIDKHIEAGIPLKELAKKSLWDKAKNAASKVSTSGPLQAAADMVLKGMGFGTLPGEFIDMFSRNRGRGGEDEHAGDKKAETESLRLQGLMAAKENAQMSLDYNRTLKERADKVKTTAEATKGNLSVELSKSIADAMRITAKIGEQYAVEGEPGLADISKISEAINKGTLSRSDIESIIREASAKTSNPEEADRISSELLKNFDELKEYGSIVEEQQKIIEEASVGIQDSIDTVAKLFVDIREILGKELKNELETLNTILDDMKGIDQETKEGLKTEKMTRKLQVMARDANVNSDELHGIIGGVSGSRYMKEYEDQAQSGGRKGISDIAKEAFKESSFEEAIYGEGRVKKTKSMGSEFEERVKQTTERLKKAKVEAPSGLRVEETTQPVEQMQEMTQSAVESGLNFEEIGSIVSESINDFLKNFEAAMKERDKDAKHQAEILKKALLSGEVKVKVTNLNEVPVPQISAGPGNSTQSDTYGGTEFGD